MPPRRATTTQSMLSFRTPGKITKSQVSHPNFKKDVTITPKKLAATSPPLVLITPPQQKPVQSEPEIEEEEEGEEEEEEEEEEAEEEAITTSLDDSSIPTYYKDHILASRIALAVHQEELPLEEKVLRHFDLSLQYGPCIGISRLARWRRAQWLGMKPPVEVLAVCLKIEKKIGGTKGKVQEGGSGEVVGCGLDRTRDPRLSYLDDFLSTRTARE